MANELEVIPYIATRIWYTVPRHIFRQHGNHVWDRVAQQYEDDEVGTCRLVHRDFYTYQNQLLCAEYLLQSVPHTQARSGKCYMIVVFLEGTVPPIRYHHDNRPNIMPNENELENDMTSSAIFLRQVQQSASHQEREARHEAQSLLSQA